MAVGGRAAARVGLLVVLALAPAADAATYSNGDGHYSFAYPDGWTAQAFAGADTTVVGPSANGFAPNIVAAHGPENGTQDSAAWLLNYTRSGFEDLKLQINLTELQAARVFITASGRRAGDFVYDWSFSNMTLRQRQVVFVSPHFGFTYVLTFSELASDDANRSADWGQAVDSFVVSGEAVTPAPPAPVDPLFVPLIFLVACAGVVFVVALFVTTRRRAGRRRAADVAVQRRAAQAQAARAPPPPSAFSRAPPGGFPNAAPARAPPVPPRPQAPPKPAPAPPTPVRLAATLTAAPPPPPAPLAPPPAPPAPAKPAPAAEPPKTGAMIRCPKCKTQFAGPLVRPAAIECPNCGTRGRIK
jgi:hypothetical protein